MSRRHRKASAYPNTAFQRWLSRHGACREGRQWVGRRSAARFWRECPYSWWMTWLLKKAEGEPGFPESPPVNGADVLRAAFRIPKGWPKA